MQSVSEEIFNSLKREYEELGKPPTKAINSSKHLAEFKQRMLEAFHFISPKSAGKTPRSPIVHIIWCLNNNIRSETECSVCGTYHARFMPDHSRATTCSKRCSDIEKASKQIGAVRSEESKLKRKQTYIERTGYANPMQNPETRLKQQKTIEELYGVSNISQLESVKLKKKHARNAR